MMKSAPLILMTHVLILWPICASSYAHDDLAGREKEFGYGYRVGFISAVRESSEGISMCTKDVPLLEVIQTLGNHNKVKGIAPEAALTVKNITDALSTQYKCAKK